MRIPLLLLLLLLKAVPQASAVADEQTTWPRHTIDGSSRGADGVRLADVNGDGLLDIVTGWEEGGVIRICRHPGPALVTQPWPAVTVGRVGSPEDAVFVDMNRDGAIDVISCCEGKTRKIFLHLAPADPARYWDAAGWSTHPLTPPADSQMWMFCLPLNADDRPSLIVGSKGNGASISRLTATLDGPAPSNIRLRRLTDAGWIMSLRAVDMDGDGDLDVLFSDRKGPTRGVGWLEQPDHPEQMAWERHLIGGTDEEVMFLDIGDLTGDGVDEVVVATRSAGIFVFERTAAPGEWRETMIRMPPGCGSGKGVAIGDVDQDGRSDLVISCEHSENRHGLFWLSRASDDVAGDWEFRPISGRAEGIKYDRIEILDLDGDGDLDVLTCEERDNLGVIWYENPLHSISRN
jgi:hypothetical protein